MSSKTSIKLSEIFNANSSTLLSEVHVWALINQITVCLEHILRDYEMQQENDDKLVLSEIKSFDDIQFWDDGNLNMRTFKPRNCDEFLPVIGPGSVNKIIHSVGLVFYDVFSHSILKSSKQPILLETDLDLEDDQIQTKQLNIDDNDYEVDLDPELEDLFMTMLEPGSESPASDKDEGYGRESPVLCVCNSTILIRVRQKCLQHFNEQLKRIEHLSTRDNSSVCPILRRIVNDRTSDSITADEYYRAVCKEMFDEFGKLTKLLNQLDESRKTSNKTNVRFLDDHLRQESTEDLKVWAQTWIKVMIQLRFGAHLKPSSERISVPSQQDPDNEKMSLKPFNKLMADIRDLDHSKLRDVKLEQHDSKRFTQNELKRASSVPALNDYRLSITKASIQKRLQELKPASERTLAEPPVTEKCLHECLMDAIRSSNSSQLKRTQTIVKPDVYNLYLEEKNSDNLKRSKSMRNFSSSIFLNNKQRKEQTPSKMTNSFFSDLSKSKKHKSLSKNQASFNEDSFGMDLRNSSVNLTSTPKQTFDNQPGLLRRVKSMNLSSKKKEQLSGAKLINEYDSLYSTLNDSETILRQRTPILPYEFDSNQKSVADTFSRRRSFIRKPKSKQHTDVWRYSMNNDPYDMMKPSATFTRSKSTSRFSISSLLNKWFIGDTSYQDDKKYKNE